jgi:CHASE2 domain-containing sensor protein
MSSTDRRRGTAAARTRVTPDEGGSLLGIAVRSAVASALVTLLYGTGSLSGMQATWADAFERVFKPTASRRVAVVAITDGDYASRDLFGGVSPLDPAVLQRLLERLAAHRPAAVAVDIQLQPPAYEPAPRQASRLALYATLDRLARSSEARWILIAPEELQPPSSDAATQAAWDALLRLPTQGAAQLTWAAAQLTAEDGLVRHIPLCTRPQGNAAPQPTVLGALVSAVDPTVRCAPGVHAPSPVQRIRYTGAFSRTAQSAGAGRLFSVGDILGPAGPPNGDTILTGKVIVLGGTFGAGFDTHWTPAGTMYGVEVWAEAFDSWWRKDALYEPPWLLVFLLQTAIGVTSGWLTLRLSTFWRYATAILGMGTLTVLFTWISFGAGFIVASSLPSFFAAQMNVQFGSLPSLLAEYVQRRVERRRRETRERRGRRADD